jgi:hypothetical protein
MLRLNAAKDIIIRHVGTHERAAWEVLWKGYQF